MITVAILINGQPIMARSATNEGERRGNLVRYRVDDGSDVWHNPNMGAVSLAKLLLDRIQEKLTATPP